MNSKKAKALRKVARGMTFLQGRVYEMMQRRKLDGTIASLIVNDPRSIRGIYRRLKDESKTG